MAPPAVAGEAAAAAAADQEGVRADGKGRGRRHDCAGAGVGSRLLSLAVQAAVMAAALALFLLFAAAAAVLLLHLVVAARAFRNHQRWGSRYRVPQTSSPAPPHTYRLGLSPAELRLLPCFAAAAASSPQICAVCIEASRAGERWRALPACGHAFHAACVDRWLARTPACPICRSDVSISVN